MTPYIFVSVIYRLEREKLARFYKVFNTSSAEYLKLKGITFVTINSMAMEEDGCTFCQEAERKIQAIAGKHSFNNQVHHSFINKLNFFFIFYSDRLDSGEKPVLLQV